MNKDYLLGHWYAYIYDQNEVGSADVQRILSYLGDKPKSVLEVACGTGRIAIPLAKAGHNVTGFDIDEYSLARIPEKIGVLPNLKYYKADAIADDWGNGFDAVILAGNVLVNIVTDGDYRQAQELFIQKAASCMKQSGHLYLDFTCANWSDSSPEENEKRVIFEGADDLGTYGKFILIEGKYDSKTRIDKSYRRYEITPNKGEMFTVERQIIKHFPTYELVTSWLDKYGWEIERQTPVSEETFHAEIWARKK